MQEGSYLLSHAAEDSSLLIYKTSDGKVTRTAYNLHKAHCDLPGVPSSLSVPWVPLDPSYLLPYHIHHGRVPCTFPPKPLRPAAQAKVRSVLQLNVLFSTCCMCACMRHSVPECLPKAHLYFLSYYLCISSSIK